jgi:hypothetical protein
MVKNKNFWKKPARLAGWLTVLIALALLVPGCKVEDLKVKWETYWALLSDIQVEMRDLQVKKTRVRNYAKEVPPDIVSIILEMPEILREQTSLNKKTQDRNDLRADIIREMKKLSDSEIKQVQDYIAKFFKEMMKGWLNNWQDKVFSGADKVNQGLDNKLNAYSNILNEQIDIIDRWQHYPPDPNELIRMAELIAEASTISLHEELNLARQIAAEFEHIGPLPVVAGTTIDRCSFIIEEGHPPRLEDLDDGVLAPGTEIIIQLPLDWSLTAPATIEPNNNNFSLDICGNQPGSSLIRMQVVSALEPNRPDDSITVTFNGIQIGNRTGIVRGSLTVLPGRTSTQDFVVLPQGCEASPLADMNFDGTVNFKDLAVLANEWLAGTEPPRYPVVDNPIPECPSTIPGFNIRTIRVDMASPPGWGFAGMDQLLNTGEFPTGLPGVSAGQRIDQFVNLYDTGGRGEFYAGNVYPDVTFPGIDAYIINPTDPADDDVDEYFATEVKACIQLTAGYHTIGANSDDGTIVWIGGVVIGRTAEFKSASTVDFTFEVVTAGNYELRARMLEGGGGSELELHEVLPDGSRILLGDVARGGSPVYAFP